MDADYDVYASVDGDQVTGMVRDAQEFVAEVKDLLAGEAPG